MRYYFIILTLIATMSLVKCATIDDSLTLNIPEKGFEVLQQVPGVRLARRRRHLLRRAAVRRCGPRRHDRAARAEPLLGLARGDQFPSR